MVTGVDENGDTHIFVTRDRRRAEARHRPDESMLTDIRANWLDGQDWERGEMTNEDLNPVFTARGYKGTLGWYVLVEWPEGRTLSVDGFAGELEALEWIEHDSAAWLASRP